VPLSVPAVVLVRDCSLLDGAVQGQAGSPGQVKTPGQTKPFIGGDTQTCSGNAVVHEVGVMQQACVPVGGIVVVVGAIVVDGPRVVVVEQLTGQRSVAHCSVISASVAV